ncbi:MAG TPA: YfbM family protein [Acetivibrio clariflavus]|nr:YfbM family protein [Acetivibrio clariflavus]HPU40986.1 YfbM family protein [Acetivibrio clariflavus]
MSMIGNYLLVDEETINGIKSGKIDISEFLYDTEHSDDEYLDIDKSWHAIHYILCGQTWEGELPYYNAVLGGTEINDEDVGYGPARYLTPSEVKEVYEAIKDITEDEFKSKFDYEELAENEIYPQFDSNDDADYVWSYFVEVQEIFRKASINGKYMLMYIN